MKILAVSSLLFAVSLCNNRLAPNPDEIGCVRTSTGGEYTGSQNVSSSGRPCVRWDSMVGAFRDHIKMLFMAMPERSSAKAQNFCRNPNGDQRGLWCFVSQLGTVQFCSVPKCERYGSTSPQTPLNGAILAMGRKATTQRSTSLLRHDSASAWSQDDLARQYKYPLSAQGIQNDQASSSEFINVDAYYNDNSLYEQSLMEQRSAEQEQMWPNDRKDISAEDQSLLPLNFRQSLASSQYVPSCCFITIASIAAVFPSLFIIS